MKRMLRAVIIGASTLTLVLTTTAEQRDCEKPSTVTLPAKRYQTFVSTDKPIYRAGENVYVRGVVLDAARHQPLAATVPPRAIVDIIGPRGDRVAGGLATVGDSVVTFAWTVPDGAAGGPYRVRIHYGQQRYAAGERAFDVRAYRAPRLKTQIVFLRDGYGPADRVIADLHVERADGGFPVGAAVTVIARVDGVEVFRGPVSIDRLGNCRADFVLPDGIERGQGNLTFVIDDHGTVQSAVKTIPILLQTVDLGIFPEGGDLVAGLQGRVYVQATTPGGKPADIAGIVVDAGGDTVASFRTAHEGRARFAFTPRDTGHYAIHITEPSGINRPFALPPVRTSGAVIGGVDDATEPGEPVRLVVATTQGGPLTVTLSKREHAVAMARITATANTMVRVELDPPDWADGVLIATVRDAAGMPLCERLVFRKPVDGLHVRVDPNKTRYVPGEDVELTIRTTNDDGDPVGAVVGVSVTDDSVREMIETREQAPLLPVMVLLEQETRELGDARVYLDPDNPIAGQAVDLLLGTQGWRRFAYVKPADLLARFGDAGRRVLAIGEPPPVVFKGNVQEGRKFQRADRREVPAVVAWGLGRAGVDQVESMPVAVVLEKDQSAVVDRNRLAHRDLNPPQPQRAGRGWIDVAANRFVASDEMRVGDDTVRAVREYAHAVRPDHRPADRRDFAETLYFNGAVRTDDQTGEATVRFALCDSVTGFRAIADAFDSDGRLDATDTLIESVEPFYIEPKLPLEVTAGDRILLPIALINQTDDPLATTIDLGAGAGLVTDRPRGVTVDAGDRRRVLVPVTVTAPSGDSRLTIAAGADRYQDKVTRTVTIKPPGFPVQTAVGGLLEPGGSVGHTITIPDSVVPGSLTTSLSVYPTPLANMTGALERLIREPHGCFEQTTSTNYPLVMVQQYFMTHTGVDAGIITRSRRLLESGYKKLTGFECASRGYEWFGADPGHEALTAFGLLEFADMAAVMDVDAAMIKRTRAWLLDHRDHDGGFTRNRRALHTWIEDRDCSNAYILWALLESGAADASATVLRDQIEAVKKTAADSSNSYVVALAANVMRLAGDLPAAHALAGRLADTQTDGGWVKGATTSIVGSSGESLRIETTSLAALAWMADDAFTANVERAMRYLAGVCEGGRYGSTQSTVLALRAIVQYDRLRSRPTTAGAITVRVDGVVTGQPVAFDRDTQGVIELPTVASRLTPGQHRVELVMTGGSGMPYSIAVDYHSTKPASSDACKVALAVGLADTSIKEGESTEINVKVANVTDAAIPTPVAIVGLPGGLEPRHDQLKQLVKSKRIAAYEVLGREVVLYWRSLPAGETITLPIEVTAAVPGEYTAPASRAYLYYTDEFKNWTDPLHVRIQPRTAAGVTS